MGSFNETEFIIRLKRKEESAFRELVDGWKDKVYNTALGLLQHAEDAEDLTQEVFLSAWNSIDEFRADASVGTWLYRITVNRSLDLIRKKTRRIRLDFIRSFWAGGGKEEKEASDFYHPGVALEKKQDAALLFKAIRQLPEKQMVVFSLQKLEGLGNEQIATILQTTIGAVESLQQRAKANLRKKLNEYFENK
ncbi:RNA polymerase sigma factor [Flavihumibacter sp.]|uniref:RNA polymerase sigma factor n=1 Tax=Flavihumibacter sp. TaxID=1913981 RepID=UPI002FC8A4DD